MRHRQPDDRSRGCHAVDFLHECYDVHHVLEYVVAHHFLELGGREGPGPDIEVMYHIR
jgi:hypothetical protein